MSRTRPKAVGRQELPKAGLAALGAIIIVLAACSGTASDNKSNPSPTPPTAAATTAPTAPPAAASTGPHRCGDEANAPGPSIARVQRTGARQYSKAPETVINTSKSYTATIDTDKGQIVAELAAKDVPRTTNNFVFLACAGFYDGLIFHRVVREPSPFVIQGGDPRGNGSGGPGYAIPDEFSPTWKHGLGALAMANSGPNTNGSQFYITLSPQPGLDNRYSVFGRVTAGLDVAEAIRQGDKILRIDIEEK